MTGNRLWLVLVSALVLCAAAFVAFGNYRGLEEGDGLRLTMVIAGLMLAYFGNLAPKAPHRSARILAGRRLAGWATVLAGLFCAIVWSFAPIDTALRASIAVTAAAFILSATYCAWSGKRAGNSV